MSSSVPSKYVGDLTLEYMLKRIGKSELKSSNAAVAVKNEKGEMTMQKVKVQRYVAGKAPEYTEKIFSDESEDEAKIDDETDVKSSTSQKYQFLPENIELKNVPERESEQFEDSETLNSSTSQVDHGSRTVPARVIDASGEFAEFTSFGKIVQHSELPPSSLSSSYQDYDALHDENCEDSVAKQRREIRERLLKAQEQDMSLSSELVSTSFPKTMKSEDGNEDVDDEESEYEDDEDSDENEDDGLRLKPVFVPKKHRITLPLESQQNLSHDAPESQENDDQPNAAERRFESRKLAAELVKQAIEQAQKLEEHELTVNTDGEDENEEAEYEAWKVRELRRIKREIDEKDAREAELREIERVHEMTEEQRRLYFKAHPKMITNAAEKGKYKYMQKYFHRGAFYLGEESDVLKRNFAEPVLEDVFDKTVLPKVMQVKNFGKAGRTKYTHLSDQDTTAFDSVLYLGSAQGERFTNAHSGGMKQNFDRPSKKRRNV